MPIRGSRRLARSVPPSRRSDAGRRRPRRCDRPLDRPRRPDRFRQRAVDELRSARRAGRDPLPGRSAARCAPLPAGRRPGGARRGARFPERGARRAARRAPAAVGAGGLGAPSPDLPNRDPLAEIAAGVAPDAAIEPEGVFEPTWTRAGGLLAAVDAGGRLLATAVGDIAATFADADIVWLDDRLAALEPSRQDWRRPALRAGRGARGRPRPPRAPPGLRRRLHATSSGARRPRHPRGRCPECRDDRAARARRPCALVPPGRGRRLVPARGEHRTLQLRLRESGLGLRARLAGGERLAPLQLRIGPDGEAALELRALDDLTPLRAALAGMVEAATADPDAALGRPLRRRAVLDELAARSSRDDREGAAHAFVVQFARMRYRGISLPVACDRGNRPCASDPSGPAMRRNAVRALPYDLRADVA